MKLSAVPSLALVLTAGGCATAPTQIGISAVSIYHEDAQIVPPSVPAITECASEAAAIVEAQKAAGELHGEVQFMNGATGSMVPLIPRRLYLQVTVRLPMREWRPGQLISYTSAYGAGFSHILQCDNGCFFAKGINNRAPDPGFVDEANYYGTVVRLFGWGSQQITTVPAVVYRHTRGGRYVMEFGNLDEHVFTPLHEVFSYDIDPRDRPSPDQLRAIDGKTMMPRIFWTSLAKSTDVGTLIVQKFAVTGEVTMPGGRFIFINCQKPHPASERFVHTDPAGMKTTLEAAPGGSTFAYCSVGKDLNVFRCMEEVTSTCAGEETAAPSLSHAGKGREQDRKLDRASEDPCLRDSQEGLTKSLLH